MISSDVKKLKTSGRPTCGAGRIYDPAEGMCISLTAYKKKHGTSRDSGRKFVVKGASA